MHLAQNLQLIIKLVIFRHRDTSCFTWNWLSSLKSRKTRDNYSYKAAKTVSKHKDEIPMTKDLNYCTHTVVTKYLKTTLWFRKKWANMFCHIFDNQVRSIMNKLGIQKVYTFYIAIYIKTHIRCFARQCSNTKATWKKCSLLSSKFIRDSTYQTLSESARFCMKYNRHSGSFLSESQCRTYSIQ